MEIKINNEWVDFKPNEIIKVPYRGKNFSTFYGENRINYKVKIKFICVKCEKEHIVELISLSDPPVCTNCKIIATRLEKYGVENFFQIKEIHEKAVEKSKSIESKQKLVETNLKIHGYRYALCDQKSKEEYMMIAHGVKNPGQMESTKQSIRTKYWDKLKNEKYNKKVVDKRKRTNKRKYGDSFPYRFGSLNFRKLIKKYYGAESIMQVPSIYLKAFSSGKRNYGIKIYNTIFGDKIHYQSKSELLFIEDCERKNIKILDGPSIPYVLNGIERYYHIDFETEQYIVEIKGTNQFYYEALESGELESKNNAAEKYALSINKKFLFLLNDTKYPTNYPV